MQESENIYYNDHLQKRITFEMKVKVWLKENKTVIKDNPTTLKTPSHYGSTTSVMSTASINVNGLEAKDALERLEMEQQVHTQELKRQEENARLQRELLEAQFAMEKAKLQSEIMQSRCNYSRPEFDEKECKQHHTSLSAETKENDLLCKLAQIVHLPKPDLQIFSGDPLEYSSFISVFENYIERNSSSDNERLIYLLQFTSGEAKKVIKGCSLMPPSTGYKTARQLLKERFGHPYVIAAKCVNKLTEGPPLKSTDRAGLLNFSDELTECKHLLQSIGYLEEINSAENLRKVVQRLPYNLKTKFIEIADNLQESGIRTNISHIADFVKAKARIANNPVFGTLMDDGRDRRLKPSTASNRPTPQLHTPRLTSLSTSVRDQPSNSRIQSSTQCYQSSTAQICPACRGNHHLKVCRHFASMSFDDRARLMRSCNLCNNCLKEGHIAIGCLEKRSCEVDGCVRRHHTLLHPNTQASASKSTSREETPTGNQCNALSTKESVSRVCLRVVPVKVKGPRKSVLTYALLDNGADVCLCRDDLAAEIGVCGDQKTFFLTTQERKGSQRSGQMLKNLNVESLDGVNHVTLPLLWTVGNINVAKYSIPTSEDVKRWPHLSDVNLFEVKERQVQLIIGSNVPEAFWVLEERRGTEGEPYAIRSPLGWTVLGPTENLKFQKRPSPNNVNLTCQDGVEETRAERDPLLQQLHQFWNNEHCITGIPTPRMSVEDKHALYIMDNSVKLVDGHYQIGLPWKQEIPYLPNNKGLAHRRLSLLKRRLSEDKVLLNKYSAAIGEYIRKGHARKVPADEIDIENKPLWYLPHHPVFNVNKPNKTRIVFDCSARFKDTSLNEQLLSGPDLTNSIVGVLTRFRQEHVALAGDIECMFHQVKVSPDDYDAFRFLWWPNNNLQCNPEEYRMEVHLFGATSSPSCASYALRKTAEDNKDKFSGDVLSTVERNFYVDDCLKSVASTSEAVTLVKELTELLQKGGFRLTKWLSNDADVICTFPETERAPSILDLDFDKERLPIERALGAKWDVQTDSFKFDVKPREKPRTRRGMLSLTSSIYDPLGFLAPIILPAKKLIQDLCRDDVDWDDPIGEKRTNQWDTWKEQLQDLSEISVRRCFKSLELKEVLEAEIHAFADASQFAYGAVSYLRLIDVDNHAHCSFLMGKSRLAHIRAMSIPRLELSAAVLASEMAAKLKSELEIKIDDMILWSDSMATLQLVRNTTRRFDTFVNNRLVMIHNNSKAYQWRFVPTDMNPADHASRGLAVKDLESSNWFTGPKFLAEKRALWPAEPSSPHRNSDEFQIHRIAISTQPWKFLEELINRHSSWLKLKRALAWILKFKEWFINKHRNKQLSKGLTAQDLQLAELIIIKHVQKESFKEAIDFINDSKPGAPPSQTKLQMRRLKSAPSLHKLNPFLDCCNVLRVGGRVQNAQIPYDAKHQVILPRNHHVSDFSVSLRRSSQYPFVNSSCKYHIVSFK